MRLFNNQSMNKFARKIKNEKEAKQMFFAREFITSSLKLFGGLYPFSSLTFL